MEYTYRELKKKCVINVVDGKRLGKITDMEKELVSALKAMLGIYAKVKLVAPKTITRSEGKAVRIIDRRKI